MLVNALLGLSLKMKYLLTIMLSISCLSASYPLLALEINYSKTTPRGCELYKPAIILSGNIALGDDALIRNWLKTNPTLFTEEQPKFVIDSLGGNVSESMKIADTFESIMASVWLPPGCHSGSNENAPRCVSACFVIMLGATSRLVTAERIGLHRPYFQSSDYKKLPPVKAKEEYDALLSSFSAWLKSKQVPGNLIDKLMSQSSKQVYWLTNDDEAAINDLSPWYEEYIIAKCDYVDGLIYEWINANDNGKTVVAEILKEKLNRVGTCTRGLKKAKRLQWLAEIQ